MQHLRLRIAHAATLLHTGGIAFVKYACRCLVRQGREAGYPLLTKIALDLISAQASHAYTERVFSLWGSDGGQAQQDDQRAGTACFPAIELEIRLN